MSKTADKTIRTPPRATYDRAAITEAICARLAIGEPLAVICRGEGMPDPATVWDWQQADPVLAQAIAHARTLGFDAIASDCLDIVDNVHEDPASRRVRAETRLKLLAKWDPKRYGDKVAHEHAGKDGGAIGLTILTAVPEPDAE